MAGLVLAGIMFLTIGEQRRCSQRLKTMPLKSPMHRAHTASAFRPQAKRPLLSQRRTAPAMDESWADVFERGDSMGHDSGSGHRRRMAHTSGAKRQPAEFNPFEADFGRAARHGVQTKPCRAATPGTHIAKTRKPGFSWAECKSLLAHVITLLVQDAIAMILRTNKFQMVKGHASAYAARAGAHMGAAAAGPAGAALG